MSLRLSLLNLGARVIGKTRLRYVQRPGNQRKDFEIVGTLFGGRGRGLIQRDEPGAPPRRIVEPQAGARGVVLYFHGGGFIAGSPQSHIALIRALCRRSGCRVVAPDYALGPEARLPAAQDDARRAWDQLIAEGIAPSQIVLAGDSAGGGMALSLMAELGAEGQRPAACVALCPWTDLTGSGASMVENARRDCLLPAERLPELIGFAAGDADLTDPRLSPLFASFQDPAPTLIQFALTEILRDDALRMADVLRAAGGRVELQSWPHAPHTWQVFGEAVPEARDAITKAATFIRAALDLPRAD
ncbi:alpha/beta hydrolase [Rhodobacteraceae bacterium N5(2021)]|uniref:Alpha/beta hydrolase n=1 Tax=Gymnodinialimonas phycosphaerae TaxID=2841589 RepID=A0A975YFP7_9RHOB|nr:alpha/beta hydrolase [Gymnodinialimonas phycosphaerae]